MRSKPARRHFPVAGACRKGEEQGGRSRAARQGREMELKFAKHRLLYYVGDFIVAERIVQMHEESSHKSPLTKVPPGDEIAAKFLSDHPWVFWTSFYCSFIIAAFLCAFVFSTYLNPNQTNVDSARLLLSALIQSEATIIALVITLTLVAVQLTSQSYTPRVANIFASSPHMYLLLGIYIVSIAYSALLLQLMTGIGGIVPPHMEFWISGAYWLTIFLGFALIPYIFYVLESFSPETFIERMSNYLTKETILQQEKNDFLNLIFDVTHNSIMKYDTATIRSGLNRVTGQIRDQVSGKNTLGENSEIVTIYCAHLERCARQAIDLHDEEMLSIILDQFESIGTHCARNTFDDPTLQMITIISEVEKFIAVKNIPASLNRVRELIRSIGKISIENKFLETPGRIMFCQDTIAKHAIDKITPQDRFSVYSSILEHSVDSLTEFTALGITTGQLGIVNGSLAYLKSIGEYSIRQDIIFPLYYITGKVFDLWLSALPVLNSTSTFLEVSGLAIIAKKDTIQKGSPERNIFERKILEIGILSMEKSSEPEQQGVARLLANLRIIDEKNFQEEVLHTIANLPAQQKEPSARFLALQERIYQEILQEQRV